MNVPIRLITPGDAPTISRLSEQLGYSLSAEETAMQINAIIKSDNDIAYVATDGDKIVGWIHIFYTMRIESKPYCEIGGLVVDSAYRGRGIGKLLVAHTKPWCIQKHSQILRVRSHVKRSDAHTFYEKAGFHETKQQKVFDILL